MMTDSIKLKTHYQVEAFESEWHGIKIKPDADVSGLAPGYVVIDLKGNVVQNYCYSLHGLNRSIKITSGNGIPLKAIDPNKQPLMWDGAKMVELDPVEVAQFSSKNRKPKSYADAGMK